MYKLFACQCFFFVSPPAFSPLNGLFLKGKGHFKVFLWIELFFITHLFMGFLAGPEVQVAAANLFLGGQFTVVFWVFVVGFGLVIPAFFDVLELSGYNVPVAIPAFMILLGGLIFRFLIVEAGQITRYLY